MLSWKKLSKNIPPHIKVSPKTHYEVLYVDDFKDGQTRGESRLNEKQLVLLKDLKSKELVETYLHEIWHIMSDEYGAQLTEQQVLALEKGSYYLLKIMKDLLK